jgi:hypothetical protein
MRKLIVVLEDLGLLLVREIFFLEPWLLVLSLLANSLRPRWEYRLSTFE